MNKTIKTMAIAALAPPPPPPVVHVHPGGNGLAVLGGAIVGGIVGAAIAH